MRNNWQASISIKSVSNHLPSNGQKLERKNKH